MSIQEIKSRLSMQEVLQHYGLKPNRNKMLNCPFHDDKTPSMQIYEDSNTVFCFSANCELTGKSIDQIDFILYKEGINKKEAIDKAKKLAGIIEENSKPKGDLEKIFQTLRKNLIRSPKAQQYLKSRNLSDINEIGYNYRTLKEVRDCIVFPLKDKEGKIVSFYGRSVNNKANGKHYYSSNRLGLYPSYPSLDVQTLVLTESIIDGLTLKQNTNYEVLALYGTNGLSNEHKTAIKKLPNLKEIVFFMDGDKSGQKCTEKYSKQLHKLLPNIIISKVETPENEDPNSLIQSHETEILKHLVEKRKTLYKIEDKENIKNLCLQRSIKLNTRDEKYIKYRSENVEIVILGGINLYPLDRLKVTLKVIKTDSYNPLHRIIDNVDLYSSAQTEKLTKQISEKLDISTKELQIVVAELTEELENYRESELQKQKVKSPTKRILSATRKQKAINWLRKPDLLERTNDLIGESGVVGEETNRLLMYLIFTSRLREQPLHIISLGSSGTGKTYLQEKISELIPQEHKLEITTLSENALYYFDQRELKNKLVLIEDLDGAQDDKILYALRELMSKKQIPKTIPIKDSKGNLKTIILQVEGPITLAGTTTKEKLYEDNANRSILIYLDNNKKHKEKVMNYQCKLSSGTINRNKETEVKEFFKDIQSVLQDIKVVNPYAEQLKIPETDFKPLRTNVHYLNFIEVITFYSQYQRKVKIDENGEKYIETTLEDIKEANNLLKEVLLNKSDELTKASRSFLELIKAYLKNLKKDTFYSKELREEYRIKPTTLKRYLRDLNSYGLIKIISGSNSKGYEYEIIENNEYAKLQDKVFNSLNKVLSNIKISGPVGPPVVHQ